MKYPVVFVTTLLSIGMESSLYAMKKYGASYQNFSHMFVEKEGQEASIGKNYLDPKVLDISSDEEEKVEDKGNCTDIEDNRLFNRKRTKEKKSSTKKDVGGFSEMAFIKKKSLKAYQDHCTHRLSLFYPRGDKEEMVENSEEENPWLRNPMAGIIETLEHKPIALKTFEEKSQELTHKTQEVMDIFHSKDPVVKVFEEKSLEK